MLNSILLIFTNLFQVVYLKIRVGLIFSISSLPNEQVVDQLNSGGQSKRIGWRTELPSVGLGAEVIEMMKIEKTKDPVWQGKCSGTVYVLFSFALELHKLK